jgi:hypothetical protein
MIINGMSYLIIIKVLLIHWKKEPIRATEQVFGTSQLGEKRQTSHEDNIEAPLRRQKANQNWHSNYQRERSFKKEKHQEESNNSPALTIAGRVCNRISQANFARKHQSPRGNENESTGLGKKMVMVEEEKEMEVYH